MKKKMIILGVIFLLAAVILAGLGTAARSMFYGIMDAPYSVYGKYWTYMKIFYIAAVISLILGVACIILARKR